MRQAFRNRSAAENLISLLPNTPAQGPTMSFFYPHLSFNFLPLIFFRYQEFAKCTPLGLSVSYNSHLLCWTQSLSPWGSMLAFNGLLERMRDRQVLWCTATDWSLIKGNCNASHSLLIRFYSVFQPCHSLSVVICINTQIKTRTTSEVTSLRLVVAVKPLQSLKTTVSRCDAPLSSHPQEHKTVLFPDQ